MRTIFVGVLLLAIMGEGRLCALEWPVDKPKFLSLFGQSVGAGLLQQGLIFDGADSAGERGYAVRTAGYGRCVMRLQKHRRARVFPGALGNALIFAHEDGLQTVYANLREAKNAQDFGSTAEAESGVTVVYAGSSAWAPPNSFVFQVIDTKNKVYLNPLLLLPSVSDTIKPTIQDVVLAGKTGVLALSGTAAPRDADGYVYTRKRTRVHRRVTQGTYRLYAAVADVLEHGTQTFTPFQVHVVVNGSEVSAVSFELIVAKDSQACLSGSLLNERLLYEMKGRVFLGSVVLTRGTAELAISARDISGNERTEVFFLQVE